MKIAYITHAHANMGGMDKILSVKANWLINKGYEVSIITNSLQGKKPFFFFDERINIYYMHSPEKGRLKSYVDELDKFLNEIKPDIAISTGMRNARFLHRTKYRCKKIMESHFSKYKKRYKLAYFDKFKGGHYLTNFFVKWKDSIIKKYDKIVLLTEEDKKSYKYLHNVEVVPNPIFSFPEKSSLLTEKRVIAVGRLSSQKGYGYMIDIWRRIVDSHPDWILNIYGEGREYQKMVKQIGALKLDKNIVIHPFSENMPELYVQNSIFMLTSRYEGLPLVLLEAMAAGLPCVSFDCKCGPSDIIKDGETGFLIPFGDNKKFAEKLLCLIENEEERIRMGKNGRKEVNKYGIDVIMQRWVDLFNQIQTPT